MGDGGRTPGHKGAVSVVIGALVIARAIRQHTGLAAVNYRAGPAKLRPEACPAGQLNPGPARGEPGPAGR